jgi:hypothetical protein
MGASAPGAAQPAGGQACDRECLRGMVTRYLDALVAKNPAALPLAASVRFTEDAVTLKPGEGLWKTITRLRPYRLDILDVRQGVAASLVLVEEGSTPSMLALRLKVAEGRITEVETMVVRNQKEGVLFEPAALVTASKEMLFIPSPSQRQPRDEAVRIAERYPAGLKIGSFVAVDVPFAPGAYRFENGRLMAGPGCTFLPGCNDIKSQKIPTLAEVKHRLLAVDEEQGVVLLRLDFGAGSVRGTNDSLTVWEAFKVYGGQIHAVEAFMEVMPRGSSSGWD